MQELKDRINRLESKVDRIEDINQEQNDCLSRIETNQKIRNVIQEQNLESLKEHISGSQSNSARLQHVEEQAIKDRSFIKGSIWAITVGWGLLMVLVGIYAKFRG